VAGGHTLNIKQGPGPRNPRHPTRIRRGQMFFPCKGRSRQRLTVKRLEGEWVRVLCEDGSEKRVALDNLLATDGAGEGIHYRFHGWRPLRRGYRTALTVTGVSVDDGRCGLLLPEWDPDAEIEAALGVLPEQMRSEGATGSCMANLASPSAAGLGIHSCRPVGVREHSRETHRPHPELLAEGQRYRRLGDGARFRLVGVDPNSSTVRAWSGRRVVRLGRERLLAARPNGRGRYYEYLGGGVAAARRERSGAPGASLN
jgi:hypothetical protein